MKATTVRMDGVTVSDDYAFLWRSARAIQGSGIHPQNSGPLWLFSYHSQAPTPLHWACRPSPRSAIWHVLGTHQYHPNPQWAQALQAPHCAHTRIEHA
eukprot:scaffold76531_cov31-Tisochrysis_lutea.AAC.1